MIRLHEVLDWMARERGDSELAVHGGRRITYAEGSRAANQLANGLIAAGLRPGDRFAILAKNSIDFVIAYLAGSKSGAVPVPINYRLAPPEWAFVLSDAACQLVLARGEFVGQLDAIRSEVGSVRRWVALDADPPSGWDAYESWVGMQPDVAPDCPVDAEADLCQMYTSGTTGRPKGAILTHRSVVAASLAGLITVPYRLAPGDRLLIVLPLFHAAGASQVFAGLLFGGSMVLHEDFDPHEVIRTLAEDDIVQATLVPAMIRMCLQQVPDIGSRRFDRLRAFFYGASPIDTETVRNLLSTFRCDIYQGYGMTETSAIVTVLTASDHLRALEGRPDLLLSAGRPVAGTEVKVVAPDGTPAVVGTPGEILVKGPQVMKGYWGKPEATAAALAGGWMRTGDIGRLDEEGYLYLLDRKNDMIVTGGENVYPREVEEAILAHPAVADTGVIGVPDGRLGETVMAFVVVREGEALTADALTGHCRALIGGYKLPRRVEFVASLPRNATGKLLKTELREPYWRDHDRFVG